MPDVSAQTQGIAGSSALPPRTRLSNWWINAPLVLKMAVLAFVPFLCAVLTPLIGSMLTQTVDDADREIQIAQQRQVTALELGSLHNDANTVSGALAIAGTAPEIVEAFEQVLANIEAARRDLQVGPMEREEYDLVLAVLRASEAASAYVSRPMEADTSITLEGLQELQEHDRALTEAVRAFIAWEEQQVAAQVERRNDASLMRTRTSWGGALLGGTLGVVALMLGTSTVLRRVQTLRHNARLLELGEPLQPTVPAADEIGELEDALQVAAHRLQLRERALRLSEERFRLAFADASVGVAMVDLRGHYVEVNAAFADMLDYSPQELRGMAVMDVLHPDDRAETREQFLRSRASDDTRFSGELRYVRRGGEVVWAITHATLLHGEDGDEREYVVLVQDISERRRLEEELRFRAAHDGLTGLPNRTQFEERMREVLAQVQRGSMQAAIVFLDLDGFKQINDALGHAVGDSALMHVASRVRAAIRPSDFAARVGGDEFVLLLTGIESEIEARRVVERVLASVSGPMTTEGETLVVRASAGVALTSRHLAALRSDLDATAQTRQLLLAADMALYRAKAAGRGGVAFADGTDLPPAKS